MNPILDETKQKEICAILSVGGTRKMAARYVGCTERTIRNTAKRDKAFGEQLRKCELGLEVTLLKTVANAGAQDKYWPAATWALEHIYPDRYKRRPDTLPIEQVEELIHQVIEQVTSVPPSLEMRTVVRHRIHTMASHKTRPSGRLCHDGPIDATFAPPAAPEAAGWGQSESEVSP